MHVASGAAKGFAFADLDMVSSRMPIQRFRGRMIFLSAPVAGYAASLRSAGLIKAKAS